MDDKLYENLYTAMSSMKNPKDCKKIFEDLFTIKETLDIAQRLEVAKLLDNGEIYTEISAKTGASTATISRVAKCLNYGSGGYKLILDKMKDEK